MPSLLATSDRAIDLRSMPRRATLHYCLTGRGALHVVHGSSLSLRKHSFVLLPAGMRYSIGSNERQAKGVLTRLRLRAPLFSESVPSIQAGEGRVGILTACGEATASANPALDLFSGLRDPIVEHFDGAAGLRDQFVILLSEFARPALGTRALTEALLKQCLILLLRRMIKRGTAPIPWMTALTDPRLARSLKAILDRPSERFTIEMLAAIAGMSRSSFAAHFTRVVGQTPMSLLRSARLRRARELLITTNASVAQVARSAGFSSRSNFSHAFRTAYGLDPTAFRVAAFDRPKPRRKP